MAAPAVDKNYFNFNELSPLDRLPQDAIETLLAYARVERIPPGRRLFNRGESDGENVFLLSGQLALIADGPAGVLKADTPEARAPIADHQPRRHTAIAHTSATVLCVNAAVLDNLLKSAQDAADAQAQAQAQTAEAANAEVLALPAPPPAAVEETPRARDAEGSSAEPEYPVATVEAAPVAPLAAAPVATAYAPQPGVELPPSPLFEGLPPAHLQMLKLRLERVEVRCGETVVRQGEPCRYLHVVESGRLTMDKRRGDASRELLPGDSFGEDILIANRPHDAAVTAFEDSSLLRLPRPEFLALVARHHVRWISYRDLPALMDDSRWLLLDIRPPSAFRQRRLHGSVNFPLPMMAGAVRVLDPAKRYVLCCDNARRLAAAAFLLARHGIKTRVLVESVKAALNVD